MRTTFKKTFVLLIVLTMILSIVTGCTGKGTTNSSTTTLGSGNTTSNTPSNTTSNPTKELTKITVLSASMPTYLDYEDTKNSKTWPYFIQMLADIGIELVMENVDADQYSTIVNTRIASGTDLPDLLYCGAIDSKTLTGSSRMDPKTKISMIENGTVVSLDKIMEYGDQSGANGTALKELSKGGYFDYLRGLNTYKDGDLYFWPGGATNSGMNIGPAGLFDHYTAQIRIDWLDKLNLQMPSTLDEFVNVIKAFKEMDANGDGLKDERMVINSTTFCNGIAQWFGLGPYTYSVDLANQKVVTPFDQKGFLDYIEFMQRLYNEGLFDPTDFSNLSSLNAANKVGVVWNVAAHPSYATASKDPNAYVKFIPTITAVDGIKPSMLYQVSKSPYEGLWAFTNSVEDKMQAAARLLDFFFSEKYYEFMSFGIEGLTFDYNDAGVRVETARFKYKIEEQRENGLASGYYYGAETTLPRMAAVSEWQRGTSGNAQGIFNSLDELLASRFFTDRNQVYDNLGAKGAWGDNIRQNMNPTSDYYDYKVNINSYCALPTKEELDVLENHSDLNTRIAEILEKLIMGVYSTDDWSSYREELTRLGFDEVLKVYSNQVDRYFKSIN